MEEADTALEEEVTTSEEAVVTALEEEVTTLEEEVDTASVHTAVDIRALEEVVDTASVDMAVRTRASGGMAVVEEDAIAKRILLSGFPIPREALIKVHGGTVSRKATTLPVRRSVVVC